jgi:hypothetical protein
MTYQGAVLWPQQENGLISYSINQSKLDFANAMMGRVGSQLGNTTGRVTVTPYDNWAALPALYPAFIGATTLGPGNVASLAISTRPHNPPYGGGPDTGSTIWNPDGLSIVVNRLALNRHPDLHLGVGKPLFGQVEFLVLPKTVGGVVVIPAAPGQTWVNSFHTINEAGQPEPGAVFGTSDFVREAWTGAFNGFPGSFASVQAEDEWTISCNAKYDELKVQEQTMATKLASVEFMAKCRPFGPLWSQIETAIMTRALGSRWGTPGAQGGQINLTLTSQSGKTITLYNVDIQGENFEFGGARLATGEVGFITQLVPGTPPAAFIQFSA